MICTNSCKEPNLWRRSCHESQLLSHLADGLPSVLGLRFTDILTCLLSQGEAKTCSHWSPKLWRWEFDKWLAYRKAFSSGRPGFTTGLTPHPLSWLYSVRFVLPILRCASRSSLLSRPPLDLVPYLPASCLPSCYLIDLPPARAPTSTLSFYLFNKSTLLSSISSR